MNGDWIVWAGIAALTAPLVVWSVWRLSGWIDQRFDQHVDEALLVAADRARHPATRAMQRECPVCHEGFVGPVAEHIHRASDRGRA